MADITNEPVGIVDNKGAWPRGDLNEKGRRLPHGTLLYAHPKEDAPYPPDSVIQALQDAINDPSTKISTLTAVVLLDHLNLTTKYDGSGEYDGVCLRVVRKEKP